MSLINLLIGGALVLIAVLLFRRYLMNYEYIFFPSKALQ
jgi:hypothetical protein